MIVKTAIKLAIVATTLLLGACDSFKNDSLSHICAEFPELCDDFYKIGDCPFNRTTVIRARYYDQIEPSEWRKRDLLDELEEYHACLELTLFLEFTRNKQRKEHRLKNYLKAEEIIKQEVLASKGTKDPILAYYLWTHFKDKQAGKVFLAAANKSDVSDPRLLFKLATVIVKEDPQKSLDLFYRGLIMSNSLTEVPRSSFVFMMNIFYQNKQFKNAYIWALIAKEEDEEDEYPINLDLILKKGVRSSNKGIKNAEQLQDQADRYYEQLSEGTFKAKTPILN